MLKYFTEIYNVPIKKKSVKLLRPLFCIENHFVFGQRIFCFRSKQNVIVKNCCFLHIQRTGLTGVPSEKYSAEKEYSNTHKTHTRYLHLMGNMTIWVFIVYIIHCNLDIIPCYFFHKRQQKTASENHCVRWQWTINSLTVRCLRHYNGYNGYTQRTELSNCYSFKTHTHTYMYILIDLINQMHFWWPNIVAWIRYVFMAN